MFGYPVFESAARVIGSPGGKGGKIDGGDVFGAHFHGAAHKVGVHVGRGGFGHHNAVHNGIGDNVERKMLLVGVGAGQVNAVHHGLVPAVAHGAHHHVFVVEGGNACNPFQGGPHVAVGGFGDQFGADGVHHAYALFLEGAHAGIGSPVGLPGHFYLSNTFRSGAEFYIQ